MFGDDHIAGNLRSIPLVLQQNMNTDGLRA